MFVYDKRGTGKSTGRFTVDFSELADDAIAAVAQARKLLPNVPVGLMGESQGGWIAPLAAARSPVDFVVVVLRTRDQSARRGSRGSAGRAAREAL